MGFWDNYRQKQTRYEQLPIEAPSKHIGKVVTILDIRAAETKYGPRWFLDVELEDSRRVTFAIARGNPNRDALIDAMQEYLPVVAKVVQIGQFVTFDPPE